MTRVGTVSDSLQSSIGLFRHQGSPDEKTREAVGEADDENDGPQSKSDAEMVAECVQEGRPSSLARKLHGDELPLRSTVAKPTEDPHDHA